MKLKKPEKQKAVRNKAGMNINSLLQFYHHATFETCCFCSQAEKTMSRRGQEDIKRERGTKRQLKPLKN